MSGWLKDREKAVMPAIEFEGPLGFFWPLDEVPLEALARGAAEIFMEAERRGVNEALFLELVKKYVRDIRVERR